MTAYVAAYELLSSLRARVFSRHPVELYSSLERSLRPSMGIEILLVSFSSCVLQGIVAGLQERSEELSRNVFEGPIDSHTDRGI